MATEKEQELVGQRGGALGRARWWEGLGVREQVCGKQAVNGAVDVEGRAEAAGGGWKAGKGLGCHNKEFGICCKSKRETMGGLK